MIRNKIDYLGTTKGKKNNMRGRGGKKLGFGLLPWCSKFVFMSFAFITYANCVCILLLLFLISFDKKSMATTSSSSSSSFLNCPQAWGRKENLFPFLLSFFLESKLELCFSSIPNRSSGEEETWINIARVYNYMVLLFLRSQRRNQGAWKGYYSSTCCLQFIIPKHGKYDYINDWRCSPKPHIWLAMTSWLLVHMAPWYLPLVAKNGES